MAHGAQREYVKSIKKIFPEHFIGSKVLEIGSLDINGSVRDLFENCDYLGIDVGQGEGVDLVCEGQKYMIDRKPDQLRKYDIVLSTECFEHNPFWLQTFLNMIRLTKSKGLTFFTCATDGRPEHGTTRTSPADSPLTIGKGWDYYMNLNPSHFNVIDLDAHFVAHSFSGDTVSRDLYFFGIKK